MMYKETGGNMSKNLKDLREFKESLELFANISQQLLVAWESFEDDEVFAEDYPFESSFDEVVHDIQKWSDTIQKIKIPVRVGVEEIYEQMYEIELGTDDPIEIAERISDGSAKVLEDEMEYIDSEERYAIYDK